MAWKMSDEEAQKWAKQFPQLQTLPTANEKAPEGPEAPRAQPEGKKKLLDRIPAETQLSLVDGTITGLTILKWALIVWLVGVVVAEPWAIIPTILLAVWMFGEKSS